MAKNDSHINNTRTRISLYNLAVINGALLHAVTQGHSADDTTLMHSVVQGQDTKCRNMARFHARWKIPINSMFSNPLVHNQAAMTFEPDHITLYF